MNSPGHHRLLGLWHRCVPEYPLEHGNATTHNHVIAHILHDGRTLTSHQSEKDRGLRDAPEKEQLTWIRERDIN